jgi:hypothetical protein
MSVMDGEKSGDPEHSGKNKKEGPQPTSFMREK